MAPNASTTQNGTNIILSLFIANDSSVASLYCSLSIALGCFNQQQDSIEFGDYSFDSLDFIVSCLLSQFTPTSVVLPRRHDETTDTLKAILRSHNPVPTIIDLAPSEFNPQSSHTALATVTADTDGHPVPLLTLCPKTNAMRALGGLIAHCKAHHMFNSLASTSVSTFRSVPIKDTLLIDEATAKFIGLGSDGALVSALDRTVTPGGRALLLQWLRRPVISRRVLSERLDAVEELTTPNTSDMLGRLRTALKGIGNLSVKLDKAGQWTAADWVIVTKSLKGMAEVAQVVVNAQSDLLRVESTTVGEIYNGVDGIIDLVESKKQDRPIIRPGVSVDLDQTRENLEMVPGYLTEVASSLLGELATADIPRLAVVYYPQVGFLVAIEHDILNSIESFVEAEDMSAYDMTLQFVSGGHGFFRHPRTTELNESIGDLHVGMVELENRIAQMLREELQAHQPMLADLTSHIARLDALQSNATVALERGFTRPTLVSDYRLEVDGLRHPIVELTVPEYITSDLTVESRVSLLMGPNSSGKSVLLAAVAHLLHLACTGSFVPARRAVIGLFDRLIAVTPHMETAPSLGAFRTSLRQLNHAFRFASPSSLVIVDEFGRNTAPDDGTALLVSAATTWSDPSGPTVLCGTHLHDAHTAGLLPTATALWHMAVVVSSMNEGPAPSVTMLYQLRRGQTSESHGLAAARAAGVLDEVVARAAAVRQAMIDGRDVTVDHAELADLVEYFKDFDCEKGDLGYLRGRLARLEQR
ncbi:DNA mismatch repair protein MSH5 [Carpediemonas membranifera]|uniref:DNA mismatch repair protein MSH5 n=1 Tax=Carpediemonas membranifera TaxID=201153 RepID=A0A8J6AYE4_9EUKA|nr:DNA mismatch repair protein MSH5 [Carpediemonas membranifera]|eukprot:KAG9394500.1 DNA mismatch repair protein MSH5 [Carpediemonas membranifera]